MNRKTPTFILGIFSALLSLSIFQGVSLAGTFYDVLSDPLFSPYIQNLYDAHLITGDTQNGVETYSFRPRDTLSRAEFTKVAVGVKLAEKYGTTENWSSKSQYEMTETVLKDKLLYFHKCDNSDVPQCSTTQGADITGICNVCQLTNEKPFTDVKEKERNCEETDVCSPWYSEYIYYAHRKGMIQGYQSASSHYFSPHDPILRIHALKLIMANSGGVDPEADERYRRLSQTAKARGSYFPKCLSGAEPYILQQNGGEENPDAQKLLKYALLADELDFFGNQCQVFKTYDKNTPEQRATFLHSYLTRQEVARYFVLSTSYSPLQIPATSDPTVDHIVSLITDPNKPEEDSKPPAVPDSLNPQDPTLQVYAESIPIDSNPSIANMSIKELAAKSKQGRCCQSKSTISCSVQSFSYFTITEEPDEYLNGQVWYKATRSSGSSCWVPLADIIAGYPATGTLTASLSEPQFKVSAFGLDGAQFETFKNTGLEVLRYNQIIKNLNEYYEGGHSIEETRAWALKGKVPGTDDYNSIEKWYQKKKKIEEDFEMLTELTVSVIERVETEAKETLSGWARRVQIHSRLSEHYAQSHDLEATKKWGLAGKSPDHDDFAYVMQWVEIKLEVQRIQAKKDSHYWGKEVVDGVNGFGAGVAGTTIYVIDVVDNNVVTPVGIMIEDGINDPGKCFVQGGEQIILGEYTDKVNICGTVGQVGLSLTGLDAPADARDVIASAQKGDAGGVVINGIGLIPVIGIVKNADELGTLFKAAGNLGLVRKGRTLIEEMAKKFPKTSSLKHAAKTNEEVYYMASKSKRLYDSRMREVAKETGANAWPTDIKKYDRAIQKSADLAGVRDLVRGSLTFDSVDSLEAAFPSIQKHYNKHYKIVELQDTIKKPLANGYEFVYMLVRNEDGVLMEVRLSTEKMFKAAKREHPIYEIQRQFTDNINGPSLTDIKEAASKLKKNNPDIYKNIESDINDIIKHIENGTSGQPKKALDELFDESAKIFKDAK